MGVVQSNSGTVSSATSFNATLPSASNAANRVIVFALCNVTIATPSGWTLRDSQVVSLAHYMWDRAGDGASSWSFTHASGHTVWIALEIGQGSYVTSGSAQAGAGGATTTTTPSITPSAGYRINLAAIGSFDVTPPGPTVSGWTNGFTELFDVQQSTGFTQALAYLEQSTGGSTAYSTGVTFSVSTEFASRIIASYATNEPVAPPTVNAGTDVGHTVNTEFGRTATENSNGAAITARSWTIQAGPAGAGSTLSTTATVNWTPTVVGTYTLRYSATNSQGTSTDDVDIYVAEAVTNPDRINVVRQIRPLRRT